MNREEEILKAPPSQETRRMGVVIHYISVFALMMHLYMLIWYKVTPGWLILSTAIFLIISWISFRRVHRRTGLWKFVWAKTEQLDERELKLTRETFQRSYQIFVAVVIAATVIVVILNKSYLSEDAFAQRRPFNAAPLLLALAHFAKTLPSSILAWTRKELGQS